MAQDFANRRISLTYDSVLFIGDESDNGLSNPAFLGPVFSGAGVESTLFLQQATGQEAANLDRIVCLSTGDLQITKLNGTGNELMALDPTGVTFRVDPSSFISDAGIIP